MLSASHNEGIIINNMNIIKEHKDERGTAIISDLAIHYPDLVEDRKIGRFAVYCLRTENLWEIQQFLNK